MTSTCLPRRMVVAALVLVVLGACTREKPTPAEGAKAAVATASATASASASVGGAKAFGTFCVEDSECGGAVCFHKRVKTAESGPERRGGGDAVEHDGYCSMRCNADSDCPTAPSNGRCGARGMCKRPE
jgi:hypothetical protein